MSSDERVIKLRNEPCTGLPPHGFDPATCTVCKPLLLAINWCCWCGLKPENMALHDAGVNKEGYRLKICQRCLLSARAAEDPQWVTIGLAQYDLQITVCSICGEIRNDGHQCKEFVVVADRKTKFSFPEREQGPGDSAVTVNGVTYLANKDKPVAKRVKSLSFYDFRADFMKLPTGGFVSRDGFTYCGSCNSNCYFVPIGSDTYAVCGAQHCQYCMDRIDVENIIFSRLNSVPDTALKYNDGKTPYELMPTYALEQIALVLKHGAAKYEPRNWEKGMPWSKCAGSLLRHVFAWLSGQDMDKESGLHHMAHAACETMFLLEYFRSGKGSDDRVKWLE